jgi:Ig-like domain-containing protein
MSPKSRYLFITILALFALTLNGCGPSASNDSVIATSVAMTVEARDTQNAQLTPTLPTATALPPLLIPPTPGATKAPPTAPPTSSGNAADTCARASLIGETVPDGTIVNSGAQFTKTWRIKNTGTCAWDSSWKLVFVQGDLMGGAYIYNFPQPALPGETVDVPVVFTAPQEDGSYKGYWKIQSPWGGTFGVGEYDSAFWVQVLVGSGTPANNKTATVYGVTAVTYDIARSCRPANTDYTITAYITTNGPVTVIYEWRQSDGNNDPNNKLVFSEASSKSVVRTWTQSISSAHTTRWAQIVITSPTFQEYSKATLPDLCY